MRLVIAVFPFLLFFLPGCQTPPVPPPVTPRFVLSDRPPVKVDATRTPYTFGYLEVPENRQRTDSRMIRLPVYIFKSRHKNPAPDPVLYTVGGPGNSSLGAAPYMRAFAYLEDRDLILFEQRGTTYAQPHLACPEWTEVAPAAAGRQLTAAQIDEAYVAAARQCRDRLLAEQVDLNGYNTREIAADIEDLRQALGLQQLNLLTISYSTKIAQVMMREYPNSLRSVVMDSPLPLAANYDESSLTHLMATYAAIFADCAASPDCATKYPDLQQRFLDFLTEITSAPLELTVDQPDGKGQTTITITGADIAGYLGEISTADVSGFPAQLDALIKGDTQVIKNNFYWPTAGAGNGRGMRLSVWCSEELPFTAPAKVAEEQGRFPFLAGPSPLTFSFAVCRTWNVRPAPPEENRPIQSAIPTLLISGSYDPVTPVHWASQLHRELSNSHQLIFPGWVHTPTTYWDNSCAMQAARAFFNDPERKPEVGCLDELSLPVFE